MNRLDIINTIKEQYKKLMFDVAPSTGNTINAQTNDGKSLIIVGEDVSEGCQIFLVNTDNTQSPLDAGDYVLTDGRTLTVVDDGKGSSIIKTITMPDPAKQEESPVDVSPATMADETTEEVTEEITEKSDSDLQSQIDGLKAEIDAIVSMIKDMGMSQKQNMSAVTELKSRVEVIANQPGGQPVVTPKKFSTSSGKTLIEEIREIQLQNERKQTQGL